MTKKLIWRSVAKMIVACLTVAAVFISCEKDESSGSIGGSQSPIGQVGNSFRVLGTIPGVNVSSIVAMVATLDDGISTISASASITNTSYLSMIQNAFDTGILTGGQISGTRISGDLKYRFTENGIQSVLPDGKLLTVIKYNAKVGDVYSLKVGANTIRREVTAVSNENDFSWDGMKIKTITVKETGRGIPGVDYLEYRCNHKFGIVAGTVYFEDGTFVSSTGKSSATN